MLILDYCLKAGQFILSKITRYHILRYQVLLRLRVHGWLHRGPSGLLSLLWIGYLFMIEIGLQLLCSSIAPPAPVGAPGNG